MHVPFSILSLALGAVKISADEGGLLAVGVDAHPLYLLGVGTVESFGLAGVAVTGLFCVHK